ncbi:helix-turn-helix transcriptional regulator [Citrobacter sp. JGM124]|uniref:helix-turn-helix transcriptional regulator n=1 Tax=Citrobacter sp. JGM124 TaxID=2799789 RepID=UPI001BAB2935|nr:helix-turn-helix transcriptional regulator [Citrobacter sp. JGM124]MBS0847585.1 helix-turn-helix domain-containing protein [Citrobacter sp. JGM124]
MKSISDIRRDNLIEIIRRCFDNKQTYIAEAMEVQQSVVSRWIKGHRNISTASARRIEKASNHPEFWLDKIHYIPISKDIESHEYGIRGYIGGIVAENLRQWMDNNSSLSSQQRVSEKAGIAQATVQRVLSRESSTTIGTLATIADAFERRPFELMVPTEMSTSTNHTHPRFEELTGEEQEMINTLIEALLQRKLNN